MSVPSDRLKKDRTRHMKEQVIEATAIGGRYHLSSQTVWRARRIADIERQFDADPHLAALVADLVDEVRSLREQIALLTVR